MVAVTFTSGPEFLGYGRVINCLHCNNRVVEQVYFTHFSIGVLYIPFSKDRSSPHARCPTCHTSTYDGTDLNAVLDAGKEYTKEYYNDQNILVKATIRRNLKKLGFPKIADYIAS